MQFKNKFQAQVEPPLVFRIQSFINIKGYPYKNVMGNYFTMTWLIPFSCLSFKILMEKYFK